MKASRLDKSIVLDIMTALDGFRVLGSVGVMVEALGV
jgi:hypothetical protein